MVQRFYKLYFRKVKLHYWYSYSAKSNILTSSYFMFVSDCAVKEWNTKDGSINIDNYNFSLKYLINDLI